MEAASAPTTTEAPAEPTQATSTSAPESAEPAPQPPENGSDQRDEGGKFLSREAASYRRRLRETETERDQLRERLDRVQTAEVERLAAGAGLQVPADVWTFGASLDTLRGEDGSIDPSNVNTLVGEIVKDRPGLRAAPVGDLGIGRGSAAAGAPTREVGLSQLLKPGRR